MFADVVSFFDLEKAGFEFVLDLNFMGTLIPTQVFARDMVERPGCTIINISSMNAFTLFTNGSTHGYARADYGQPADEEQVWSIYKGNARVKR